MDPAAGGLLESESILGVLTLVNDLKLLPNGAAVEFLHPAYLGYPEPSNSVVRNAVTVLPHRPPLPEFSPSSSLPEEYKELLASEEETTRIVREMLVLCEFAQADGLVSQNRLLLDLRYVLKQHHNVRVVPLEELGDLVEVCAHGHSIFWSATSPDRRLTFDTYYQITHWKANRLFSWYNDSQGRIEGEELKRNVHSVLLNRYPFVLYSRDMVKFYDLQRDHFTRRGLMVRFGMGVGYFVTSFHFHLWGLLDQLTVVAKHALNLRIDERSCGIRSDAFWTEIAGHKPQLARFIQLPKISEWIDAMAEMRHATAHRVMSIPGAILIETPESQKTDEEIREMLPSQFPNLYSILPGELIRQLEPQMIWHYRVRSMQKVADTMVLIKTREGEFLLDPVVSIDYDLERLNTVLDAFLISLFSGLRPNGPIEEFLPSE